MAAASRSLFALPAHHPAASDPGLVAADAAHFARIEAARGETLAAVDRRTADLRRAPGRSGEAALERDLELHRAAAQRRLLTRYGADLCLGRMTPAGGEPVYIGRTGMSDAAGRRLLVDWRAPAAEPFFAATLADPRGLVSRRRFRWAGGRVVGFADEILDPQHAPADAVLDEQSSFLASLAEVRSDRMRDVLATIQADQHEIIRAAAPGALVVDGGPGTGKTVVALHRAAALLQTDPMMGAGRGGVLFIGPGRAYLDHVDDVLPSLGEDTVRVQTLRDLVAEGAGALAETSREVARLKGDREWVRRLARVVARYERPPEATVLAQTPWADVEVGPEQWSEAFAAVEPGTPHDEARDEVWRVLCEIVADDVAAQTGEPVPFALVQRALARDEAFAATFVRAWPLLDAGDLVAALWGDPHLLAQVAPDLTAAEVAALQRVSPRAWTVADLPLLDAARDLVGDPDAVRGRRRAEAERAAEREVRARVADELIAADDSELMLMSMLRGEDVVHSLDDDRGRPGDGSAGPFAHVIVDEAQELSDAEWQMLVRRCPSRSFTIVGDRAQARHGFAESWADRLARVGVRDVRLARLRVNYRTPQEVMDAAAPVIRAVLPDANVPDSARRSGLPVEQVAGGALRDVLAKWRSEHRDARACLIGDAALAAALAGDDLDRVMLLDPEAAKGLEFDLVVLVRPGDWGSDLTAAVDRYVAMTRTTRRLVIVD